MECQPINGAGLARLRILSIGKLGMRGDKYQESTPPPIRSSPEAAVLVVIRLLQHPVLGDTISGVPRAGIAGKYGPKQLAESSVT